METIAVGTGNPFVRCYLASELKTVVIFLLVSLPTCLDMLLVRRLTLASNLRFALQTHFTTALFSMTCLEQFQLQFAETNRNQFSPKHLKNWRNNLKLAFNPSTRAEQNSSTRFKSARFQKPEKSVVASSRRRRIGTPDRRPP